MTLAFEAGGSVMRSANAARRFTATRALSFIAARYVEDDDPSKSIRRAREMIYFDGAFQYPYEQSFSEALGGGVTRYTVVRDGGWPEDLALHAEEIALPTEALPMGTVYEVDFRELPSQSLAGASGTYAIDGLDWYAKGPLGTFAQLRVVNGQGIELKPNNNMFWGDPGWEARILLLPLSEVPDYNPLAPLIVRGAFDASDVIANGNANNWYFLGLMDAVLNGSKTTAPERAKSVFAWSRNGPQFGIRKGDTTGGDEWSAYTSLGATRILGVSLGDNMQADAIASPWDGSEPLPLTTASRAQMQTVTSYLGPTMTNPCIALMLQCTTFLFPSVYLTHLSISQPRVA